MQSKASSVTLQNGAIVETGTIVHNGHEFSATGAVIDTSNGILMGYPKHGNGNGVPNVLRTWAGQTIAELEITGHSRGFHGVKLTHYACDYQGHRYSGKGSGEGMSLVLRKGRAL